MNSTTATVRTHRVSRLGARLVALAVSAIGLILTAGSSHAAHAVNLTGAGDGPQFGTLFSVGWDFTVSQTISVTALGQFDPDSNPKTNTVVIYQRGGAKVAETSVLATSPAEMSGSYSARYETIPAVVLSPGNYVIVSTQNGNNFIAPGGAPTASMGTGLTWNRGVALNSGSAAGPLPATAPASWPIENGTAFRYFGPTFNYELAPVGPVSASTSTVTASPASVATDGTTSTITVTLKDANNLPVSGKTVTLARNGNTGAGTPMIATVSGTTNASGIATFTVVCSTVGAYDFEATGDSVVITQKATVTFALSAAKDFLTFGTNITGSSAVINTGAATVAWAVPTGTSVTALAPTYTLSAMATGNPASGNPARDFTSPQTYTITAQDGSTKDYTVTVTASPPGFRYYKWSVTASQGGGNDYQVSEIAFFSSGIHPTGGTRVLPVTAIGDGGTFADQGIPGLYDNNLSTKSYMGGGWPRSVTFDFGTPRTFTGYAWATANDITPQRNPAAWTVSGSNDNATWTVLDTRTGQGATPTTLFTWASGWPLGSVVPAADILTFGPGATIGTLAGNTAPITWVVPYGTDVTTLAPTFTRSSGATCTVDGVAAVSGETRDFTNPVAYTVTSSDLATINTYTVTVIVASQAIHALDLTSAGDGPAGGGAFTVGWDFTVSQTISVTYLGQFDPDGNPKTNTVAIYQRGGAKLVEASVLTASPAEMSGNYSARYAAITTVVLSPGNYVIVSTQNGDNFIASGGNPTATLGTGITWNKGVAFSGAGGPLPATAPATWQIENTTPFRYFGPTFKFSTAAPAPPTQLAIPTVNGGSNPTAGTAFSLVVQARDAGGAPQNVSAATAVNLSLKTGTGTLGGTLSGTIAAGTSSVTISGVTYSKAESGVVLTATRTSGDSLTAADSAAFTVATQPPLSALGTIMPMGDSITLGVPVAGGYRDPLYTLLNNRGDTFTFTGSLTDYATSTLSAAGQTHHEGHSGYVIANGGGRSGLDENLAGWIGPSAANPDKILLMIGSNDINLGYDMANAPARLSTLITHIYGYRPNVKLFVASIIPMVGHEPDVQAFNATLPGIVASHQALGRNVVYVPMYEGMDINTDLADGLHPNALGYQHMAEAWESALHPNYASWADGAFSPPLTLKGAGDDQDGDTLTNLQEFAFGTEPTVATGEIVYAAGGAVTTPGAPKIISDGGMYSMVFGRRADYLTAGITCAVQFSAGLDVWVDNNDTANPPVQVATNGTIDALSVPYPDAIDTPSGSRTPTFSRIKVAMP